MKAITAKQAKIINIRNGMGTEDMDGCRTYWATDDEELETWIFDNKKERDEYVRRNNHDSDKRM